VEKTEITPRRERASFVSPLFPPPPAPDRLLRVSVADGDKSPAIADINRYERGRQTKYTNVNIRPAWEGAGGCTASRGKCIKCERKERSSRSPPLLSFSPVRYVARPRGCFSKASSPRRADPGARVQMFDDGEREGWTIEARARLKSARGRVTRRRGRLLSPRCAISGGEEGGDARDCPPLL